MTGITRQQASEAVGRLFGTSARQTHESRVYDPWEVKDADGKKWRFVYGSSIQATRRVGRRQEPAGDSAYKVELNSPVLEYAEMGKLQEVVRALRHAGAVVNPSCGLHVHIDASKHTPRSLRNLLSIMYSNQEIRWIRTKVSCAQCGARLIRKTDKRRRGTIWCCPECAMATRPTPDNELVQLVTNKLAAVADLPEPPKPPEPRCRITRQELCLQREFDRALNVSQPDVRYLIAQSQKIAAEAYQRSQCSHVWLTAQIQNRLLAWPPGTPLEQDVFEAVVSKILLAAEASVQIQLTNQQVL